MMGRISGNSGKRLPGILVSAGIQTDYELQNSSFNFEFLYISCLNMNITIPKIHHSDSKNFFLIAGPCVVEGRDICFEIAEKLITMTDKYKIPLVFKGSYRKANRTKVDSFTGIGDEKALKILE